ncbi:hypothetical protein QUB70_00600 [Microcoleus sp. A003_D6]
MPVPQTLTGKMPVPPTLTGKMPVPQTLTGFLWGVGVGRPTRP